GLAEKEAAYNAAIAAADNFRDSKTYDQAKSKYQEAASIKPNEAYPPEQIALIDGLLAEMANKEAQYAQFIAQGDTYFSQKRRLIHHKRWKR
ncbi:MAG: hypothetical protein B7C24_15965, partial [Bacteroidetes bacterium 4572_77]